MATDTTYGRKWCHCCSNEFVVEAAEKICESAMQELYMRKMCVGSLSTTLMLAHTMMCEVVIATIAATKGATVLSAAKAVYEEENEITADFMVNTDRNVFVERLAKKLIATREIYNADEAFTKEAKGD